MKKVLKINRRVTIFYGDTLSLHCVIEPGEYPIGNDQVSVKTIAGKLYLFDAAALSEPYECIRVVERPETAKECFRTAKLDSREGTYAEQGYRDFAREFFTYLKAAGIDYE